MAVSTAHQPQPKQLNPYDKYPGSPSGTSQQHRGGEGPGQSQQQLVNGVGLFSGGERTKSGLSQPFPASAIEGTAQLSLQTHYYMTKNSI